MHDHLNTFILRCSKEFSEQAQKHYEKSRDRINIQQKEYFNTEDGKKAKLNGWKKRSERVKDAKKGISNEELFQIKEFYSNCPEGYVVDHKTPLCRGGSYNLENLQYLSFEENAHKGMKTQEEWDEVKHFYGF